MADGGWPMAESKLSIGIIPAMDKASAENNDLLYSRPSAIGHQTIFERVPLLVEIPKFGVRAAYFIKTSSNPRPPIGY